MEVEAGQGPVGTGCDSAVSARASGCFDARQLALISLALCEEADVELVGLVANGADLVGLGPIGGSADADLATALVSVGGGLGSVEVGERFECLASRACLLDATLKIGVVAGPSARTSVRSGLARRAVGMKSVCTRKIAVEGGGWLCLAASRAELRVGDRSRHEIHARGVAE